MQSNNPKSKISVLVPATSANLGAGFDVLGLALNLHNVFAVVAAEATRIEILGYGAQMPLDETNLFYQAFAHLFAERGLEAPALDIQMQLQIPPGRGLGSSATAVVGGLVAANAMLGNLLGPEDLLPHAIGLERGQHADNVAPALLGGLVVNVASEQGPIALKVPFPGDLKAVVFIPEFEMDTVKGRALMPPNYSRTDVVFSTGRIALFMAALNQQRYDLLRVAMQDRLHQPYRAQLFPQMNSLISSAIEAGASGACLSGGGSSIIALATAHLERIAAAMQAEADASGIKGKSVILDIDTVGARVTQEGVQ